MKIRNLFAMLLVAGLMAACGGESSDKTDKDTKPADDAAAPAPGGDDATDGDNAKGEATTFKIDTEASTVKWEGHMTQDVKSHHGFIDVKSGKVMTKGGKLSGGNIVIDMTTITPTDENYTEESPKSNLVGHLSSGDFFLVEKFPTASFKIKSVKGNTATGDLTIRDNTHEETIEFSNVSMENGTFTATGNLVFDRQKYDVKWQRDIVDKAKDFLLADEISLEFDVKANKQ